MTISERLRELRDKAGMTQESLAASAGMSIGTVRNYEQGIREPHWRQLFQLARALGVSCEEFAACLEDGAAEMPPTKKKGKGK